MGGLSNMNTPAVRTLFLFFFSSLSKAILVADELLVLCYVFFLPIIYFVQIISQCLYLFLNITTR